MTDAQKIELVNNAYLQWFEGMITDRDLAVMIGEILEK